MQEDGVITDAQLKDAMAQKLNIATLSRQRRDNGYHIVDQLGREAKQIAGMERLTDKSYTVRSTIHPQLQQAAEKALQEGLARYEQSAGRTMFRGAEANLTEAIRKLQADPERRPHQAALAAGADRVPPAALRRALGAGGGGREAQPQGRPRVRSASACATAACCRSRPIPSNARRLLSVNDVIFVNVIEGRIRETRNGQVQDGTRVDMRIRPTVQGAAVVLENRTGRILAMAGGFSYPLSQLNRATQSRRQPGSSFKPVVYLAALSAGTAAQRADRRRADHAAADRRSRTRSTAKQDYKDWWSPKNYDGGYGGTMTLRRALENSKNLATAHLLDGGIAARRRKASTRSARSPRKRSSTRSASATIRSSSARSRCGRSTWRCSTPRSPTRASARRRTSSSRSSATARRSIARSRSSPRSPASTGRRRSSSAPSCRACWRAAPRARSATCRRFVGGKTGTSDDENDAWFVGFSNDVTIAVWVGYDNKRGKRTLGGGQTGGKVAVPIFEPIMQAVWQHHAPKTALRGPSPEASRQLVAMPIDLNSGDRAGSY